MPAMKPSYLADACFDRVRDGEEREKAAHRENLFDDLAHADQDHLALLGTQALAGQQYDAQAGRADVVEIGKIKHQTPCAGSQTFCQHLFEFGGTGAIQVAYGAQDDDIVDGLGFKFHGGTGYPVAELLGIVRAS